MMAKPAVSIRRIHAEPAEECTWVLGEVAWLALSEAGDVTRYDSARALLRAARRRDQRDAARADRRGLAVVFVTVITWHNTPPGFVPPTSESEE